MSAAGHVLRLSQPGARQVFPILKLFRLLVRWIYGNVTNFKSSFLSLVSCLVFIPSPRQISTPQPPLPFGGREEEKEGTLGRQAGGQRGVDLGSCRRNPGRGLETEGLPAHRRGRGGRQGRPGRGAGREARRGGGVARRRVLGAADRARRAAAVVYAGPSGALPRRPASLPASARRALRISLVCSPLCVSYRKCTAICNVLPGPRMEEWSPRRIAPIPAPPEPASSQSRRGERPEGAGWPPGPGARPGREPAGWALGCHSADLRLRAQPPRMHFYHCAPLAACFLGGSLRLCGCAARRGAMDTGVNARGSTRRPGTYLFLYSL